MRIQSIRTGGVGPLTEFEWEPGSCEVVFDDNQQGKTTLIDLVINRVFKEGRKVLYAGEDRYEEFSDSTVELEFQNEVFQFGGDGSEVRLSELLGWNMPELHRLLCIRAGQLEIHGEMRGRSDMWNGLATLLAGMGEDSIEEVKRAISSRVHLTPSFQSWSSRKELNFKETMEEIAENLSRFEDLEEDLREFLSLSKQNRELEIEREEYQEKLTEQKQRREELRAGEQKLELQRAGELIRKVRSRRKRIQDEYGRIDPNYREAWEQAADRREELKKRVETTEEKLEKLESNQSDLEEDIASKEENLNEIKQTLEELDGEVTQAKKQRDQTETEIREQLYGTIQPLADDLEQAREQLQAARNFRILELAIYVSGALSAVGGVILWGLGFSGFGPGGLIFGLVLLAGGGFLNWRRAGLSRTETKLSHQLKEELNDFGREPEDPLEMARELIDRPLDELIGSKSLEELEQEYQEHRERRASLQSKLESDRDQLDSIQRELNQLNEKLTEELKPELEQTKQQCEEFRQKTGCTAFETYREKLQERETIENEIDTQTQRLAEVLETEVEELDLSRIEVDLEERLEELEEVEIELDNPREALENVETRIEQIEAELDRINQQQESLNEEIFDTRSRLTELEIDPEQPGSLFERHHEWRQRLTEAIFDRFGAVLVERALDELETDYFDVIQRLLGDESGELSLNQLYQSVMGEDQKLRFRPDDLSFELHQDGKVYGEETMSSGARSHLYFSCRLLLLDRLFEEEPGFMILDDPFLHYFPERKQRAVQLLAPFIDRGWQLLVFTVDPGTRDGFEELGATVRSIKELG